MSERAHLLILYGAWQRTKLTQRAPTASCVTTTLRLGDGVTIGGGLLTHRLQDLSETEAFPYIHAFSASGDWFETLVTFTSVTARSVDAATVLTDPRLSATLIKIHTALSIRATGHAGRAEAHKSADLVFAEHTAGRTVIETFSTLILVSTHSVVVAKHVSGRAHALVRAKGVDATEGAEQRIYGAFIDIFTGHHGPRFETFLTGTLEPTRNVRASTVSTRVSNGAFVRIDAVDARVVQVVAERTLAAERAVGVDAYSVAAYTRVFNALVHVLTTFSRSQYSFVTVRTQGLKRSFIDSRAKFTRVSPSLARQQTTAAFGFGGVEGFGYRAFTSFKSCKTEALAGIKAASAIIRQHKTRLADALETAWRVFTRAKLTYVGLHVTLVDVDAFVVLNFVSGRTDAAERAVQVLTGSRLASTRDSYTFIDIDAVLSIRREVISICT